ncbi:hypothetical protein PTTG_26403 [Puccinia triticina 1-1 BBBD Race 1]|uniref:BED-type domain-containing protein n=1 Tax=Puccinia triticina (isolate 1-1 / race 1 (BBBD)) TaxID=630390 RepID=A0A180GUE2_PUCT1|nr:hypothetical protein PTTG_26403 [Puccinia triticina 1-1 BBBD Race 1]
MHVAKRSKPETPSSQQPQVTRMQTRRQPPADDGPPSPDSQSESQEAKGSLLKKRKLTSKMWAHFEKVDEGGVSKAECNYCHIKLSAQLSAGTNHLRRHSERCAAENGAVVQPRQGLLSFTSSQTTSNRVWIFSQDKTREKFCKAIIKHKYPFAMADHIGFREFMESAQPNFTMPRCKAVQSNYLSIYSSMNNIEMAKMAKSSMISLTTNMWTALDLTGYMTALDCISLHQVCITLHDIIPHRPLPPPHSGHAISDHLFQVVNDWKIINKLAFVTFDNAANNTAAMIRLHQLITNHSATSSTPTPTSPYFHVRCLAHVINLVVKDGLKVVGTAVEQLRTSVHYIHGSSSLMDAFEKALVAFNLDEKMKTPSKDVPTRWNPTFLMIESLIPCKLAFQQLKDNKFDSCPSEPQWEELNYPTINHAYCAMIAIEKEISAYIKPPSTANKVHTRLSEMVIPMKQKFGKYWEPAKDLTAIGLVLDPQYKIQYLRYSLDQQGLPPSEADSFLGKVRSALLSLWNQFVPPPQAVPEPSTPANPTGKVKKIDEDLSGFNQ